MTTIVPPGISPTGERVERIIENVGTLVFENYAAGEWLTQKGEPAKKPRRRYLLDDDELDAVSSIVGTLDKFALRAWIEKEATFGAVRAERLGELEDVPEEDWVVRVKSLGLGATAKKEEGQERGTVIHTAADNLTRGIIPNPAEFPAVGRPWVQGMMRAWLALDPKLIASERIACHPELRYAGRPDLIAEVDGGALERITGRPARSPRPLALLDYKSGKGKVYQEAHYQTRLYEMASRFDGLEIEHLLIVGIDDEGGFRLVESEATEADATALLHVYRSCKRINSGMADQRRIAKAAAS